MASEQIIGGALQRPDLAAARSGRRSSTRDGAFRYGMTLPTVLDIYEAKRRLGPHLQPTPLLPSRWLSSIADGTVFMKVESLNLTNSFKIRGALNAALQVKDGTIVTASAGNQLRFTAAVEDAAAGVNRVGLRVGSSAQEGIFGYGLQLTNDSGELWAQFTVPARGH